MPIFSLIRKISPQINFSHQNYSVENIARKIIYSPIFIFLGYCATRTTTTSINSILYLKCIQLWPWKTDDPVDTTKKKNSSKWIWYSLLWIFYIHWHLCKILWRPNIMMCRMTIKILMMVSLSHFGYNVIPLNITIGKNSIIILSRQNDLA